MTATLLITALQACSEDATPDNTNIDLGCRLNSDCPSGQICQDSACVDSDVCTGPQCPCEGDEDCPGELLCDVSTGQCFVPRCFEDLDCGLEKVCLNGRCETDLGADRDRDGVPDAQDVCPEQEDTDQLDTDGDGSGDACDLDDDNDAVPDTLDNCALVPNTAQADANRDGTGNACDALVRGTSVVGTLDASQGGNADTSLAQVFITGRAEPVGVDVEGRFVFDQALAEGGTFGINVRWQGFVPVDLVFEAPVDVETLDVGTIVLRSDADDVNRAALMTGRALLRGEEDHSGIVVRVRIGGALVATTLTDPNGVFALDASQTDHTLEFSQEGFFSQQRTVLWDHAEDRFEIDGEALDAESLLVELVRTPQSDRDADGVIDLLDNCVDAPNLDQQDLDGDGLGDQCDRDIDNDGIPNGVDNCPASSNPSQEDPDGDGHGIACVGGDANAPFEVGCGIRGLAVDTRTRRDGRRGSCGGVGAADLSLEMTLAAGEEFFVKVDVNHAMVMYVIDATGRERHCALGDTLSLRADGEQLAPGPITVVIDGFSTSEAGPVKIDVTRSACESQLGPFEPRPGLGSGGIFATADFDGDGFVDVATGGQFESEIGIHLGDGRGNFEAQDTLQNPDGEVTQNIEVGDFNNDGAQDLVIKSGQNDSAVHLVPGRGDGTFEAYTLLFEQDTRFNIQLEDMDNDSNLDIVGTVPQQLSTFVRLGDGDDSVGAFLSTVSRNIVQSLVVADFNADGNPDVGTANGVSNSVSLLDGLGDGGLRPPRQFPSASAPFRPTVGDFNLDGFPDLAVLASDDFAVHLNDRSGFLPPTLTPVGLSITITDDFNNDGKLDFLASSPTALLLHRGLGNGGFRSPVPYPIDFGEPIASADFNNDGVIDTLVRTITNGAFVSMGQLQGTFHTRQPLATGDAPTALKLLDLDGDNIEDLLVYSREGEDLSVRRGLGQGRFSEAQHFFISTYVSVEEIPLFDVNGDGHTDVLLDSTYEDALTLALGFGDGTFDLPRLIRLPDFSGKAFGVADFNEDGSPDIAAHYPSDDGLALLLGQEDGTFDVQAPIALSDSPEYLRLADLNEDGSMDVLANDPVQNHIAARLGLGDGTFGPLFSLQTGFGPGRFVVEDIDNDGALDVIATSFTDNTFTGNRLSVHRGLGDGTFRAPNHHDFDGVISSLMIVDVDDDGIKDITLTTEDTLYVLLGNQNSAPSADTVGSEVGAAGSSNNHVMADFNADGFLDFARGDNGADLIRVAINDGQNRFVMLETYGAGTRPRFIASADLDEDGQGDILILDVDSDTVSIFRRAASGGQSFGTTLLDASGLVPCPPTVIEAGRDLRFDVSPLRPCRIERLLLDLDYDSETPKGTVSLSSPQSRVAVSSGQVPSPGLWRPEAVVELARFEGHPLSKGEWALEASFPIDGATLIINRPVMDPFDAQQPSPFCTATEDQSSEPNLSCRLDGSLEGLEIEDRFDEDTFVLEGPLDGAFVVGQVVRVTVDAETEATLDADLRLFRAAASGVPLVERAQGRWEALVRIEPSHSGRLFALHVRSRQALTYSVLAETVEDFEFQCGDGIDGDRDGLLDCEDPDCTTVDRCQEALNCADGVDNDFDGATDCQDDACADSNICLGIYDIAPLDLSVTIFGTMTEDSPTFTRPEADCSAGGDEGFHYEAYTLNNPTDEAQNISLFASWAADGYLHVFTDSFDPQSPEVSCIVGNDDAFNIFTSRIEPVTIGAGESITIVASTFDPGAVLGSFSIFVGTVE